MYTLKNKTYSSLIEALSQEFEGRYFYGIEYILDDLKEDQKKQKNHPKNTRVVDWFGLSDWII